MTPLLLACLLATPSAPATALEKAARSVAEHAARKAPAPSSAIAVCAASPETPELARATQTALVSLLTAVGFKTVIPLRCAPEGCEEVARAANADWLARITVRLEGSDVTLAGDLVPTWVSFWTGRDLVRAPGGGPLSARATADAQVLTLAHLPVPGPEAPARGEVATRFALRLLARLNERVVALAVGDLDGDRLPEIIALTPSEVLVLKAANGHVLARHDLGGLPRAVKASREPAGALAIEATEGGKPRLLAFSFARSKGEALELEGGELKPIGSIEQPALCAGGAGTLLGAPVPGKNVFAPEIRLGMRAALLPFAPIAVAANRLAGSPAFVAVSPDGAASVLDAELGATELSRAPLGAAIAVGDFDGDGAAELVTTLFTRGDDRVRLTRFDDPKGLALFESEPFPAVFASAAAGELSGDGRDEAVVAAWNGDGTTALYLLGARR